MPRPLPIIPNCDNCGACCQVVTRPPFVVRLDGTGEPAWELLAYDRPDLRDALLSDDRARKASGRPSFGTPCLWYDPDTACCRHYQHRPQACRTFEVGSTDCRDARRRGNIKESSTLQE